MTITILLHISIGQYQYQYQYINRSSHHKIPTHPISCPTSAQPAINLVLNPILFKLPFCDKHRICDRQKHAKSLFALLIKTFQSGKKNTFQRRKTITLLGINQLWSLMCWIHCIQYNQSIKYWYILHTNIVIGTVRCCITHPTRRYLIQSIHTQSQAYFYSTTVLRPSKMAYVYEFDGNNNETKNSKFHYI